MGIFSKIFGNYSEKEVKRVRPIVKKVLDLEDEYSKLSDAQRRAKTHEFKERLKKGETNTNSTLPVFQHPLQGYFPGF